MAQKHTQSTDLPLPQYMLCLKNSPCFARTQPVILSKAELTYLKSYFPVEFGHLKLGSVDESGSASKNHFFSSVQIICTLSQNAERGKRKGDSLHFQRVFLGRPFYTWIVALLVRERNCPPCLRSVESTLRVL